MIIIKIKTWKDYKKDFINWVQAPRRKTCKEFVNYMASVSQQVVDKRLAEELDKIEGLNAAQKRQHHLHRTTSHCGLPKRYLPID